MAGNQALALLLIFGFSFAIAKNWRKVLIFLGALAMTAVCFGVYTIVDAVHSDVPPTTVAPSDLRAGLPDAQSNTAQEQR
ncbi:hypothetical protein [Kribbella sp. NPDC055071]